MKTRAFIGGLLLVIGAATGNHLLACGDKFLNLGLGTHYERTAAERQSAAILMYADTGSALSRTLAALSVEAKMKKEGYRPTLVTSQAGLDAALSTRTWDVVVVDGPSSQAVSQRSQSAGKPRVVPVLTKPTKDELREARRHFQTVLNTPTKSGTFLDSIEDALDLHEAEVEAAAKAARKATR